MEQTNKNPQIGTTEWITDAFSFDTKDNGGGQSQASTFDKIEAGYQGLAKLLVTTTPEGFERVNALQSLHSAFVFAKHAVVKTGAPGRGNA